MEESADAVVESQIIMTEPQDKDQHQDDNESTQYSGVELESREDYTYQFTPSGVFESKDALIEWVRAVGRKNNIVIIIRRSDSGIVGNKKKRPKIKFCCERGGDYKRVLKFDAQKSYAKSQKQTDGDGQKKKRPKASGTKKCGCPFALRGINTVGNEWTLEVICGVHNHPPSQSLHGHSYVGRLSKEEYAMLVDMSTSLMRPKDILTALKKRDKENVTIMKTIYNARRVHRTKVMAGRSQMQCLLHKLREHNYIEHHRSEGDIITDLFWCHPYCLQILRTFPHVLIMDCTYKTNRYCFPLFEIVGVTSTEKTFNVAFVYMSREAEDNYTWALSRLKTLLRDDCTPGVIVTDRELALMNSIRDLFPSSRHLLCKWHINKNVMKECKKKFTTKEGWDAFNGAWNTVVSSATEGEYWKNLKELESKFSTYPNELQYVKSNWLDNYKERFVVAWTDTCMHIGTTTSNRVESAHSKLKKQLSSSQLDFNISWDNIHSLMELHHTDIKASFEKSRCFLQHDFKHDYLKELISYVSITALNKIVCEANRADNIKDLACCSCTIRVTHGLPCAHEIAEYKRSNTPIPIDAVHRHWRQLGVDQPMHTSDTEEKVPVKQHMVRLEKWVEKQNDETRREFLIKIDELMNPGSTFLKEPAERVKTKGRPRKIDTSTRRLPSAWEIDNVLSSQDKNSLSPAVYEVGQDVPHGPIVPVHPTTEKKQPKDVPNKIQSPKDSTFALTTKYNCQFRVGIQPYIIGAYDVESDGNCGYRVVASAMGFGRKSWRRVRRDLLNELDSMPQLYESLFGAKEVKKVKDALNHYNSGSAPKRCWMYFPEMGHLIATCYGVVVIDLSDGQCITFLPLVEHHSGHFSSNELQEIGIGHVNSNHFIHLKLSPGHPLPKVIPNWERNADAKVIHLYSRYQNRLQQYKECCPITVVSETFTLDD
ncbi:uncharacterized protein LOC133709124 [Rosa rugosa]|uniref:uncharacterized protein LOC133709124 n=1 Tax=Rosa rugosa TaxID=74645 RepID=UPI002B408015|nr:uncharacterized protein LOC133709124 [Rosa rugosa]